MLRKRVTAAIAVVCVIPVGTGFARAQEAPTPGGNVTADEASVLPPVVVNAPNQPIVKTTKRKPEAQGPSQPADGEGQKSTTQINGQYSGPGIGTGVFTLGQLDMIGGSTITNEAMWTFDKNSLDQAVNLLPGVSANNTGGSRNERDIFVRGFDRFRVPLSIDGVRIYLPADNRLDFARFLTPDLSEVQVAKGYVSVLDGPGGIGGAINLVSRKPTKAVELESRAGIDFSGTGDGYNGWNSYAYAGTRQEKYYAQVSGTFVDEDHFNLSNDFHPTAIEDGGDRDHSSFQDWRLNVKAGYTPNASDEYSINYTKQVGEKEAPLHVDGQVVQGPRYWQWPDWNLETVSWLSKTRLGSASYIKTNAYYNTFYNVLSSYDDATYTTQNKGSSFDSTYDDYAYGGSLELGTNLIPMNTLKGAIIYRHDNHSEFNFNSPTSPTASIEPKQYDIEDTWSFALENTFHATRRLDVVTGISYNLNEVDKAEDYSGGVVVDNAITPTDDAFDYQGGLIYSLSDTGKIHATVSSRTRFPTFFERYSTRFGTAIANPNLTPERATNYEVGWEDTFFGTTHVSSAVFYSDLKDSIQSVFVAAKGSSAIQGQNVDGQYYGFEISVDHDITKNLRVGGNYTYLERDLYYTIPGAEAEGTPRHKGFLYLSWAANDRLNITPSLELASNRYSLITGPDSTLLGADPKPNYAFAGAYALANIDAEYKFGANMTGSLGVKNIFDDNYELVDGFPEAGRTLYAKLKAKF